MNITKHWAGMLDDYVIDLAWSPDGSRLAAAATSGPVTLMDAAAGAVVHHLSGHAHGTNVIAWQPDTTGDGQRENSSPSLPPPAASRLILATGGQDGAVRFWDAATGTQTAVAAVGSAWVEHLCWRHQAPGTRLQTEPTSNPKPDASLLASDASGLTPILFAAAGRKLVALNVGGSVVQRFMDTPKSISALALADISPAASPTPPAPNPRLAAAYFGGVCL
ncbi:MAG: hypothetical protein PHQ04_11090 [Opitutaceae bacterium]|nr:hypothetical protein [Opitutaceae bacterium]